MNDEELHEDEAPTPDESPEGSPEGATEGELPPGGPSPAASESEEDPDATWGDIMLTGPLKPRHRKLAELLAQGMSQKEVAEKLGYTASRVSILASNSRIKAEIDQTRERIYEETVGGRLKKLAEPALNEIERCLTDRSNRYKEPLKVETAKWLVEKIDGKATQKHDIGENLLGVVMDRLDALKAAGRQVDALDVTPHLIPATPASAPREIIHEEPKSEEDLLSDWIEGFDKTLK